MEIAAFTLLIIAQLVTFVRLREAKEDIKTLRRQLGIGGVRTSPTPPDMNWHPEGNYYKSPYNNG